MRTNRKHGFTVVELVVVIAIIAVLAAVLIPTFTSIIKKANDSAYLQERQSQQIADLAEKVEKMNYFTWEDFEKKLAEELAKVNTGDADAIEKAVDAAIAKYAENQQSGNTGLTAEQVQKIVNESMKGQLTTAQVEAIVNQAVSKVGGGVSATDVQAIVKTAIAGMGQTGLNAAQVKAQIASALASSDLANKESVSAAIAQALSKFETLSEQQVAEIISQAIKDQIPSEGTIYIDSDRTLEANKTYILRTQKYLSEVTLTVPDNTEIERIIIDAPNVQTVNIVYAAGATQKVPVKLVEVISTATTSTHINVNAVSVEVNKGRAVIGDQAPATVTELKAAPSTNANVIIELAASATVEHPVVAEYQDHGTGTGDTITVIDNTATAGGVNVQLTASSELASTGTTTTNVQLEGTNLSTDNVENKVATTTNEVEVVEVTINNTTYVKTEDPASEYSLFAGGTGTAEDPYLVASRNQLENMSHISSYSYYKWVGNSVVDASNWSDSIYLCGSFDGNGVTFNNLDCFLFRSVWNGSNSWDPSEDTTNTYTVKNLTVNANIVTDGWIAAVVRVAGVHNFVMEDVTVHGYVEGSSGVASFICFGPGNYSENGPNGIYENGSNDDWQWNGHITFINCNSDAIIVAKSGNGVGFIAHAMLCGDATVTLENSNYTGSISGTAKYICGNWINATITDDQSSTKNNVIYKTSDNGWKYIAEGKTSTLTIKSGILPANIGDAFVLDAESGATKAIISLVISPNPGCFTSTYMSEEVNAVDGKFTSESVKYFTIRINAEDIDETGAHGNYYDVVNDLYDGSLGSNTIVRITQYNSTGTVISITNISFNDK